MGIAFETGGKKIRQEDEIGASKFRLFREQPANGWARVCLGYHGFM